MEVKTKEGSTSENLKRSSYRVVCTLSLAATICKMIFEAIIYVTHDDNTKSSKIFDIVFFLYLIYIK